MVLLFISWHFQWLSPLSQLDAFDKPFFCFFFSFQERDNAFAARHELEREVELMKERLDANQRVLEATKAELDLRENRLSALDREVMVVHTHQQISLVYWSALNILPVCLRHTQVYLLERKRVEGSRDDKMNIHVIPSLMLEHHTQSDKVLLSITNFVVENNNW